MHFKKIFITAAISLFFLVQTVTPETKEDFKTIELRYRCRVESVNPLWHILFFLFGADNRDFLWREKVGHDGGGYFRKILLFNRSRQVVKFFAREDYYEAEVDFGSKDESGVLTAEQAKFWFEIEEFAKSALPGEKYEAVCQTSKNAFLIFIEAREKVLLKTSRGNLPAVYFEGRVIKQSEDFLHIKFWIGEVSELRREVVKCFFKKSFWPPVVLELIDPVR